MKNTNHPPCLKYWTARSCFSASARVSNVPRFLRLCVFALTLREYRRYLPDFNFLIIAVAPPADLLANKIPYNSGNERQRIVPHLWFDSQAREATAMDKMMRDQDPERVARVTKAFLKMKKFDLAALQRAYDGQ